VLARVAQTTADRDTRVAALVAAGIAANRYGDPAAALDLGNQALDSAGRGHDRMVALNLVGSALKAAGNLTAAYAAYAESLRAAEAAGETRRVTVALNNLGTVAHDRGDYDDAAGHYRRSLDIKRAAGDEPGVAVSQVNLGGLYKDMGDHATARTYLSAAIEWLDRHGNAYGSGFAEALLAEAELGLGRPEAALHHATRAATRAAEIEHSQTRAMDELALGRIALARSDRAGAAAHLRTALGRITEPFERVRILEHLAAAIAPDEPDEARARLAEAEELRHTNGFQLPPIDRPLAGATRHALAPAGRTS
jgi:tetratricopeptide (TPR) repeat protein